MKNLNKKKLLIGIFLVAGFLAVVGISYAYWTINLEQTDENKIATSCFDVKFEETPDSKVKLPNAFPLTDEEGEKLDAYTFTVKNNCKNYAKFNVQLEVHDTSKLDSQYIKIKLDEKAPKILNEHQESDNLILDDTDEGYILDTDYLDVNETKSYSLRIWLDENVTTETKNRDESSVENSTWGGYITLSASYMDSKKAILAGKEIPIVEEGNGLYEVKHDDVSGTVDDLGFSQTEYRYAGSNPDNYVKFNDELWRIIGLVNVLVPQEDGSSKVEQRLKIIRNEPLDGYYGWDHKAKGIGSSTSDDGSNDWTDSQIMELLNGIYFNSENGICEKGNVAGQGAWSTTCKFDGTGIDKGLKEVQNMIDQNIIWNIGGITYGNYSSPNNGLAKHWYNYERGNIVYSTREFEWKKENTRNSTGIKKEDLFHSIGLIYLSDYGYATSGGDSGRDACLRKELYNWNTMTECNNWINVKKDIIWPMNVQASDSYQVFCIGSGGNAGYSGFARVAQTIFPTLYLKSNVIVTNLDIADGSSNKPYELALT